MGRTPSVATATGGRVGDRFACAVPRCARTPSSTRERNHGLRLRRRSGPAAVRADSGERVDLETGRAKMFASEVAIKNSLEAMRIHGGHGYSEEFGVERLYRDAVLMSIGEGTNDILRTIIAKQPIMGKRKIA
ncbi:acyl-CoA dehydrogenase family protein [Embleya scabrispora]|uniref:acyl-CoA dehydrogenase family protein n=1 Tax=Embleya scabrispora TaxID=159449 RepID=UPI001964E885|nr:acyl-CoA dehydrogenase family protein [Embleya scabrispora]